MSDYSTAPQANLNQSQAFAAALQRAKQIAAKIQPSGNQLPSNPVGVKRSFEDEQNGPEAKKFSSPESFTSGSQQQQQQPAGGNMTQALAQAAAVAARLAATGGSVVEEEIRYPEKIISAMVGRGSNENLSHIEAESGCKVQLSNDSNRCCTLRGTRESVNKAREMIQQLVNQQGGGALDVLVTISMPPAGPNGFPPFQEIMVPGPKVGLIIGKGGETIKMLQEKTGAKMVIIQDGPNQEAVEKPLRISGDPQKIEHAKSLVFDLIRDKESNSGPGMANNSGGGGGLNGDQAEVFVPKIAVGVVIGKGGDMIKKIQGETGCKLQFVQGKNDEPGDRRCIIQGNPSQVDCGKAKIESLIESVLVGGNNKGNRNNSNNHNNNQQSNNDQSNYGYGYGVNHTQQPTREEVTFSVPASKCGIVIGRGGETIKLINQQSGAYCEMDRNAVNPPSEKLFKAKGTTEQIEHARQLISEKINMDITITSRKPIGNDTRGNNGGGGGNRGDNRGNGGHNKNYNNDGGNYQQQQQQWGQFNQQAGGWDQSQQQPQDNAVNPGGPSGGQNSADYSQQWIEYYKSMGMVREAEAIEQQLKQKQQQEQAAQNGGQGQSQDYSAQWAEYYRSIGKIAEAEAIEKQITTNKSNGNPQNVTQPGPQQPQQGGGGGYPQNMGNQYSQYSQYYASAPGQGQGFQQQQQQQQQQQGGGYSGGYKK